VITGSDMDTVRALHASRFFPKAVRVFEVSPVAKATQASVAEVARRVVAARKAGRRTYTEGSATFVLDEGGYCARFVRQCCEVAAGLPAFGLWFAAPTARQMEENLRAAGKRVSDLQDGDIIACNNQTHRAGHIAIFLGDGEVAENTVSGARGDPRAPGTKISPLAALLPVVSGYYRPFAPSAQEAAPRLVLLDPHGTPQVIECNLRVEGSVSRVDLRAVAEALGFEVIDHLSDQGKVYVKEKR
jgi:hypothetical protein